MLIRDYRWQNQEKMLLDPHEGPKWLPKVAYRKCTYYAHIHVCIYTEVTVRIYCHVYTFVSIPAQSHTYTTSVYHWYTSNVHVYVQVLYMYLVTVLSDRRCKKWAVQDILVHTARLLREQLTGQHGRSFYMLDSTHDHYTGRKMVFHGYFISWFTNLQV